MAEYFSIHQQGESDVPGASAMLSFPVPPLRGDPERLIYDEQDAYDCRVAHVLFVDGFGKGLAPHDELYVQYCLAGSVVHAARGLLVNPVNSFGFPTEGREIFALWQLVYAQSQIIVWPITLRASIYRLAVPIGSARDWTTNLMMRWKPPMEPRPYMPYQRSFGYLADWARSKRPGYNHFTKQEREALRSLVVGWRLMQQELIEKVKPRYQW